MALFDHSDWAANYVRLQSYFHRRYALAATKQVDR